MAKYSTKADNVLVACFCAGQNEAFDELLSRYKDRIYSYITNHIKNADLADDLFQETFIKAIMHLRQGRYDERGSFYAWLTRIAHNLLIDQFRCEGRKNIVYKDAQSNDWNDVYDQMYTLNVDNEATDEQLLREVSGLINELPAEQRDIVVMRYYNDLSYKEIAAKTGMSINTALGRMYYAVRNMRKMAKARHIGVE